MVNTHYGGEIVKNKTKVKILFAIGIASAFLALVELYCSVAFFLQGMIIHGLIGVGAALVYTIFAYAFLNEAEFHSVFREKSEGA